MMTYLRLWGLNRTQLTGAWLSREFSGMIHKYILSLNNHPSNHQQPIHSLRLAPDGGGTRSPGALPRASKRRCKEAAREVADVGIENLGRMDLASGCLTVCYGKLPIFMATSSESVSKRPVV
jgi:hypothetical protein